MKLWKVTVNNWGWDNPRTIYTKSRAEAAKIAEKYPAADKIEYAGNFTDENAERLAGGEKVCFCF